MSDAPLGPDWWRAGDGKWYPAPPGLTDASPSRPPTPPPDHDPVAPAPRSAPFSAGVYRAGRLGAPVVDDPPDRRRRGAVTVAVAAVVLVALLVGVTVLVTDHSSTRASSNDPAYQQAIVDLLGSERTNIVFLQTFWEDYRAHQSARQGGRNATPGTAAGSEGIDAGWVDDMQAQVDQFSVDLTSIDSSLEARPWSDGSVADHIRDLARSHYQTWHRWTNDVPSLVHQWLASKSPLDLWSYIDDTAPQLDAAINQTFHALCAVLSDTKPSDGRFDVTIDGICHE